MPTPSQPATARSSQNALNGGLTVTQHNRSEWSRMAQDAYAKGRNDVGHRMSAKAALPEGHRLTCAEYDAIMGEYRAWLIGDGFTPKLTISLPAKSERVTRVTHCVILFKVTGQCRRFENGAPSGHPFTRHFKTHAEAIKCAESIDNSRITEAVITPTSPYFLRQLAGMPDAQD